MVPQASLTQGSNPAFQLESVFSPPHTYAHPVHQFSLSVKTASAHPFALQTQPWLLGPDKSPCPVCSPSCSHPLYSARYGCLSLGQDFSALALLTFGAREFFVVGCGPKPSRMFSNSLDLCPLPGPGSAALQVLTTKNVSSPCRMRPRRQNQSH